MARFRRCCRFRSFHLAFWLLLSFARDALVHLNAIGCSVAVVLWFSERPDPPGSHPNRRAGTCHDAPRPARHDQTTVPKNVSFDWLKLQSSLPNFSPHVAAYPAGRVHRAVPSHKDRQVALRRPAAVAEEMASRRWPRVFVWANGYGTSRGGGPTCAFTSRVPPSTNIGSGIDLIDDLEVGENLPRRKLFDFLLVQTVEPIKERPLVRRQFRMLFGARHGDSTCFGYCSRREVCSVLP